MKGAIPDCPLVGAAGHEIATAAFAPPAAAASGHNELEVARGIGTGAANMRSIDADDELFASIAGKLHFKLASFVRLRPCVQFFLSNLIVEPFANPDSSLAHGGMRLGRLNGQEFGKH
ncbi:hypothetical protein, partial [Mesorhizobium sp.]|uniref:hypothetical protein n=2 Tax=Mesorhizobium sp. TaxID=1871066 RepID=UPI0025C4C44A